MESLLLVNTPPWGVVMPPLGIAYLAEYLRNHGAGFSVCDLNLEMYRAATKRQRQLWDLDAINRSAPDLIAERMVCEFDGHIRMFLDRARNYRVIGLSASSLVSAVMAGEVGKRLRQVHPDSMLIAGGPGVHDSWDRARIAPDVFDFFVVGEGEEALLQLMRAFTADQDVASIGPIAGVISARGKTRRRFVPARPPADLKVLPFPTFSDFPLSRYNPDNPSYRPLPLLLSRGCVNRCSYCVDWSRGFPFRVRRPEHILDEIRHHKQKYGITHVECNDLLCNGSLSYLERVCDALISGQAGIQWVSYAAIRPDMSGELLKKIKHSGCVSLCFGLESASDNVLRRMNKKYTREDAARLLRQCRDIGLTARVNIIVGFPGETETDFEQTCMFLKEHKDCIAQVTNVSAFVLMPSSDAAIFPHTLGIRFFDRDDPGRWTDAQGMRHRDRDNRVQRLCACLEEYGIAHLIVNSDRCGGPDQPGGEEYDVPDAGQESAPPVRMQTRLRRRGRFRRRHAVYKGLVGMLLIGFVCLADAYLFLLKRIRGSIIFPGS